MRRVILPYNPKLKLLARKLRNSSTLTEIMLWNELKRNKILGYDFDRQKPIGNFIVDFYCKDLMLAIEIDGESHYLKRDKDEKRQMILEKMRVRFLRYDDMEIRYNLENVLKNIEDWINKNK